MGNDPEIALDTQEGVLCLTVPDSSDPLGILDPACGVTEEQAKLDFVPAGCKGGKTWVRKAETVKKPSSKYGSLPSCAAVKRVGAGGSNIP